MCETSFSPSLSKTIILIVGSSLDSIIVSAVQKVQLSWVVIVLYRTKVKLKKVAFCVCNRVNKTSVMQKLNSRKEDSG